MPDLESREEESGGEELTGAGGKQSVGQPNTPVVPPIEIGQRDSKEDGSKAIVQSASMFCGIGVVSSLLAGLLWFVFRNPQEGKKNNIETRSPLYLFLGLGAICFILSGCFGAIYCRRARGPSKNKSFSNVETGTAAGSGEKPISCSKETGEGPSSKDEWGVTAGDLWVHKVTPPAKTLPGHYCTIL